MKAEHFEIARLQIDPDNARRHTAESIGAIARSLRRFGQQKPVVVNGSGLVIAGNGTVLGAMQLGWSKVWVVRSELDRRKLRAYAIADNRIGELSDFDDVKLREQLRELSYVPDGEDAVLLDLGWTEDEINALLVEDDDPGASDGAGSTPGTPKAKPIEVTREQREVFERALAMLRADDPQLSEGRAVELLAADWLGAAH